MLLTAAEATALAVVTIAVAAPQDDTTTIIFALAWWVLAAADRRSGSAAARRRRARSAGCSPRRARRTRCRRSGRAPCCSTGCGSLAVSAVLAAGLSWLFPQFSAVVAGGAILIALAWRKQEQAVTAIEERDGVRFYVVPSVAVRRDRAGAHPGPAAPDAASTAPAQPPCAAALAQLRRAAATCACSRRAPSSATRAARSRRRSGSRLSVRALCASESITIITPASAARRACMSVQVAPVRVGVDLEHRAGLGGVLRPAARRRPRTARGAGSCARSGGRSRRRADGPSRPSCASVISCSPMRNDVCTEATTQSSSSSTSSVVVERAVGVDVHLGAGQHA